MKPNIYSSISQKIFQSDEFSSDLELLFRCQFTNDRQLKNYNVKRLLETAAVFSLSNDEKHQTLSFKISVFLMNQLDESYNALPFLIQLILIRLGDLPTLEFLISNEYSVDYFGMFVEETKSQIKYLSYPEVISKRIFNRIEFLNIKWNFTDFQIKIFDSLNSGQNVTFSAPTSAGKSYTIHRFVAYMMLKSDIFTVIYVAPSKSLISEIHEKLTSLLGLIKNEKPEFDNLIVFTSVNQFNIQYIFSLKKWILILTPERLQQLSTEVSIKPNVLILDEAQKVSDEERGIIIEDVVYDISLRSPKTQKIFVSPNMEDPERFKIIFQIPDVLILKTLKSPVGQNLFFVDFDKPTRTVSFKLHIQEVDKDILIQTLPYSKDLRSETSKKAWVALNLPTDNKSTIIYCNIPSQCRNVAEKIIDTTNTQKSIHSDNYFGTKNGIEIKSAYDIYRDNHQGLSEEISEIVDFLSEYLHSEYYLIDYLKDRVGYHYGKMPHFVRQSVRKLFDDKQLDYLCCTSTLLEGVNMPAKNIVLFRPKLGLKKMMDKGSVLNLAGRAGRLTKEYYGNIFCIDVDNWENEIDYFDGNQDKVSSAVEKTLLEDMDLVLEHLTTFSPLSKEDKNIEVLTTSMLIKSLKFDNLSFLNDYMKRVNLSEENFDKLFSILSDFKNDSLPIKDVILKNPTIDPRSQIALYNLLKDNYVLPMEPTSDLNFFYNLSNIFRIISEYLLHEQSGNSFVYYAFVAKEWILHQPYKIILENKINYFSVKKKRPKDKKFINEMIENLEDIIENKLKYYYARGLKCYCDLLTKIYEERNMKIDFCDLLPEYLEYGASDEKILFLMSLGISRTTSIKLYEKIDIVFEDMRGFKSWLKKNYDDLTNTLPKILLEELKTYL